MSERSVVNFVHSSIADRVTEAFAFDGAFAMRVDVYDAEPSDLFENAALRWTDPSVYAVVFLPPSFESAELQIPAAVAARVTAGTLRFVLWDATVAPTWGVPVTLVPAALAPAFRQFTLAHLTRVPSWGLQMLLPPRTRVLTERVRSEAQVAQKIDESIRFATSLSPAFEERTMALRLALTVVFDAALGDPGARAGRKPPTYQIAVVEDALVCGVRWTNPDLSVATWDAPTIGWRMLFGLASASFAVVSPQSGELEVTLVFDGARSPAPIGDRPLVIDVLSSARQGFATGLTEMADLEFEYFDHQPQPEDAGTFVTASTSTNPSLELAGLRVEYHKLGLQLKQTQEVSSDHLRRMGQALESEKAAEARIKKLEVQIEYAKEKEAELTRKLQSAMDQWLTLKTEKNGRTKKAS